MYSLPTSMFSVPRVREKIFKNLGYLEYTSGEIEIGRSNS